MLSSEIVISSKSVVHVSEKAFKKECEENHMSVEDHEDPNILKAWYGKEYMGYFNLSEGKGFLLLESMAPPVQSMLH